MSFSPVSFRTAVLVVAVSFFVFILLDHGLSRLPLHIEGDVEKRFDSVRDVFAQNFKDGWERGGASLAVFEKGKLVVDLWGGYADRDAQRKWKKDTLQITFSTTKGISAIAIAMLVDRGHLTYNDLVTKYWPEFGKHGKGNLTVEQVLCHMAGLVYLDEDFTFEESLDHHIISKRLEDQRPQWPPGTATGYHVYTFGWLADQLVRRVDPKKRSVGQFIKEELHDAHGVDFHVGLPDVDVNRVARLYAPSLIDRLSETITDIRIAHTFTLIFQLIDKKSMLYRALNNVGFLESVHQMTTNNPDYWKMEQPAAMGIGNARSLAQIYSLLGEKKLISEKTLSILREPAINLTDVMIGEPTVKGHGFFYNIGLNSDSKTVFGHPGHGCQQSLLDVDKGIAIAYTTNALKMAHAPELCRTWRRLNAAIYAALEKKR